MANKEFKTKARKVGHKLLKKLKSKNPNIDFKLQVGKKKSGKLQNPKNEDE
jgi:hypothetical protein